MSNSSGAATPFSRSGRVRRDWPSLSVEYAWLPPFEGATLTQPNRVEVVFTRHEQVVLEQAGRIFEVNVVPGAMFVVGSEPTILNRVREFSDTLELYFSQDAIKTCAARHELSSVEFQPSLNQTSNVRFEPRLSTLSAGHLLRKVCLGLEQMTAIEADHLSHLLLFDLLVQQRGIKIKKPPAQLCDASRKRLVDFIEANLNRNISLVEMADLVNLSPFHFARCFKSTTGLAPHGYVTARRLEHAKQQLISSGLTVQDIAWDIGYENISHFRRQFTANIGVRPGELRKLVGGPARSAA